MISTFALAMLLAAGGPEAAQQAAEPAPTEPKVICRRIPELGSRVRAQRVCRTKEEWAAEREENRKLIDRAQVTGGLRDGGN